jgi:transposase
VQITDPRDIRIAQLEVALAERDALITKLVALIEALEIEVARLSRNSTNSSKPPSSDPPGVERQPHKPSGKKRGGQPGHPRHQRKQLPPDQVDEVIRHIPERCGRCGKDGCLVVHAMPSSQHQVVEVPPIKPSVIEHQQFAVTCGDCGAITVATLPPDVPRGAFGARLMAMLAVITAKYRLSKRSAREMLSDFLGIDLCLGSVSKVEKQVSAALAAPYDEARTHVKAAPVVHADETSWRENKKKAWLWVAATPLVSVFLVATSRGGKIAKELLGEAFAGYLVTDRWSAYQWVKTLFRQLCWSHLLRDFQSWVDGGGAGVHFGKELLKQARWMFKGWHKIRDGTLTREGFVKKMLPVATKVSVLLSEAAKCHKGRVAGMAKAMLKLEDALWTFVHVDGVEPTNNFGERIIRHAVLWRKGSFGTDSTEGSRFVERMLTTIATLRQQRRNVLEFITAACMAALKNAPAPSLLPSADQSTRAAA